MPDHAQAKPGASARVNSRVNARLDEQTENQLRYITERTGHSVSHVLRDSVARYYVQSQQRQPSRLLALLGKGDSARHDVASSVKQQLSDALASKHGLRRR